MTAAIAAGVSATAGSAEVTSPPASLHLGSRGAAVVQLQQRLVGLAYLPAGSADGVYGMRTWHAVVAFQGWERMPRDGIVGPRTRVPSPPRTVPDPGPR